MIPTPKKLRFTGLTNFLIITFFTCIDFNSGVVYSTSLKKQTKNQTAFFLIPNSWQVFVETIYDVTSQPLFDNVNVEGEKYFPYISMIFVFIILNNFSKPQVALDSPTFWQTGFQDPASISMEVILFFNKHLTFLLVVFVLFVIWFFACLVYYIVGFNNHYKSKFVFDKTYKKKAVLSEEVICLLLFFFVTAVPFIFYEELFQIPITRLDPVEAFQEESGGSEPAYSTETKQLLSFLESGWITITANNLAEEMVAKGHGVSSIMNILIDKCDDSFWWLEYRQQIHVLERHLGVSGPYDRSETELSLSIEKRIWFLTTARQLVNDLSAKGYSKTSVITILENKADASFRSLEYDRQLDLLEDCLIAEKVWWGFCSTIIAACSIAAITVAVVWRFF